MKSSLDNIGIENRRGIGTNFEIASSTGVVVAPARSRLTGSSEQGAELVQGSRVGTLFFRAS